MVNDNGISQHPKLSSYYYWQANAGNSVWATVLTVVDTILSALTILIITARIPVAHTLCRAVSIIRAAQLVLSASFVTPPLHIVVVVVVAIAKSNGIKRLR